MAISKRVAQRLQAGIKQYAGILRTLRDRDVSEADTVTVVKDLLCDVFGYDKYAEVTSEHAIRGTFCDLAINLDGKLKTLLEVKAIGSSLNDRHIKQTIDYAANQGVDWVFLTNGIEWVLYHVLFQKPIEKEEITRVNLLEVNPRSESDADRLFLLTKEGFAKDALKEFRDRKDATSHHMLAAIILNSDAILKCIRKEVRKLSDIAVDTSAIEKVLRDQVIKREAIEGAQAEEARRRFVRKQSKERRAKVESDECCDDDSKAAAVAVQPAESK